MLTIFGIGNTENIFTNDNFRPLQPLDKLPTEDDDDEVAVIDHLLEPPVVAVLAPAAGQLPELLQPLAPDPLLLRGLDLLPDELPPLPALVAAPEEEDDHIGQILDLVSSARGVKLRQRGSLHPGPHGLLPGTHGDGSEDSDIINIKI